MLYRFDKLNVLYMGKRRFLCIVITTSCDQMRLQPKQMNREKRRFKR